MGGVSSVLKTERNNICGAYVSDQSTREYKENISAEIEDKDSLYPVLKSNNTVSSQVLTAVCKWRDFLNVIGLQI
jgi:predicted DNA-binding ArsR family transcriptional regulator